jgi:hypothetical protein
MERLGPLVAIVLAFVSAAQEKPGERIWTCPEHREVTSMEEGRCPICAKDLIPALVREAWSCPVHTVVAEPAAGKCPICGRALYPISREVSFSCPMHAEVREIEPGSCPVCRMALVPSDRARPHQDHNPKRGGAFFMAPDAWHHLEGVYPEEGIFRVYLYDNFSRPLSAAPFEARAVLEESYDAEAQKPVDLLAYPLLPSPDGEYLEARVGPGALPREITAKIQFLRGGPFERFDFVFASISTPAEPAAPRPSAGALLVPSTPEEIAIAIAERNRRLRVLVLEGALSQIYVPAIEAKDLALALETRAAGGPDVDRTALAWALKELVRAAWLLDDYGDLGNRELVEGAYRRFDEASSSIASLYGVAP